MVRLSATAFALALVVASGASAQQVGVREGGLYAPSIFDLDLGQHALELPADEFIDYACGTNGGPPSLPLKGWADFAKCPKEAATGLHEIYFRHDDEPEFWARANNLENQINLYAYTSVYAIPIIASALFDDQGFLRGIRMVTDPRVSIAMREKGASLTGFLQGRYGDEGWTCADATPSEGESPYRSTYIKRHCERKDASPEPMTLVLETHNYRKAGQAAIDPFTRTATEGQFVSATRFQLIATSPIVDGAARTAAIRVGPSERDQLAAKVKNCPGCDLKGVNLKRADLTGANLAGADLSGANLHAAVLAGANLEGANLSKANVNRADVKRANLKNANLQQAMLYESRFDAADLTGADLTEALAGKIQLIRANLTGAKLMAVDFRNGRLNDANFSNADLTYSWMHDAQMARSDFTKASLVETVMWRVQMVDVKARGADFEAADLYGALLRGADLSDANFAYARLTGANLADATLTGATWTEADLPIGFEPKN